MWREVNALVGFLSFGFAVNRGLVWLFAFVSLSLSAESLEILTLADGTSYRQVTVTEVNPHRIVIRHARGLAQVKLRDLAPEWQAQFNYDPSAEAAFLSEKEAARAARISATRNPSSVAKVKRPSQTRGGAIGDTLLRRFGTPAEVLPKVDLRPKFAELELGSKNQGRRPSCSVFAVVSALEYQNALLAGQPEQLSEEYLIWATRRVLGLDKPDAPVWGIPSEDASLDADAGFGLLEVVQALRSYGIPLASQMPNTFGSGMAEITSPPADLIQAARDRCQVHAYRLMGRDNRTRLDNILHCLNEGVPVVIGIRWPPSRTLWPRPLLSGQQPREGYAHAVTLVGYQAAPEGTVPNAANPLPREGVVFVFKNSWGPRWGSGGHGFVTWSYLEQWLLDAVILEVRR